MAELTGSELVALEGYGHLPFARDPVRVDLEIHDFLRRIAARPVRADRVDSFHPP